MPALAVLTALGALPLLSLIDLGRGGGAAPRSPGWRASFLASGVLWGALLAAITFCLSLFEALTRLALSLSWAAALVALAFGGWRSGRLGRGWAEARRIFRWSALPKTERWVLGACLLYALLLFIVAWVAPPNTNDSLRYHMSRVMHWQQNQALAHYNTPIEAQLSMPPWSELAILNTVVLSGGDRLANLVQWLAMAASLVGVSWIARQLGAGLPGQVFAVVFALSLPMGILQSTSTQNDYTAAFWTVCLAAFVLQDVQGGCTRPSPWKVGLAAGLGILTKATFYAFAAPLLLVWLAALAVQRSWRRLVAALGIVALCVLLLNAYFWWQNTRTFGFPLGPAETVRLHANQSFTPTALLSNLLRNATLHLGTPYGVINGNLQKAVEIVHRWMGQDVNGPATTLDEYHVKRYLTEDRAGSPWHFLALPMLAAAGWASARSSPKKAFARKVFGFDHPLGYAFILLAVFIVFSSLYKWQSTGSRLQLPWFVLLAPLAGVLWEKAGRPWLRSAILAFFLVIALPFIFNNPSRPFLPFRGDPHTIWNTPRQVLLFRNHPEVMPGYLSLASALQASGCSQVGLWIDSSDPEYLFWALLADAAEAVRFEHLFPSPPVAPSRLEGFAPCAILCTTCTASSLNGLPLDSTHFGGFSLYLKPGD
jgi:hypothetical protein